MCQNHKPCAATARGRLNLTTNSRQNETEDSAHVQNNDATHDATHDCDTTKAAASNYFFLLPLGGRFRLFGGGAGDSGGVI
ncbi:hypothetical protein K239x_23820 [Planctomycetes bacterium K23_9]|uniref:Uncharacterized protein n=1 Tax=Stieleria marina TaxID=1930275 RepID=A0A517NTH3_9BACT|nr:hypothetical protein K239x_23820 [Planctomycetes bacterium K23_9]